MYDFDKCVYIVTMRCGENLSDSIYDNQVLCTPIKIMGIYENENNAIKIKNFFQKEADENGFGDCDKYYVEPWLVHKTRE